MTTVIIWRKYFVVWPQVISICMCVFCIKGQYVVNDSEVLSSIMYLPVITDIIQLYVFF